MLVARGALDALLRLRRALHVEAELIAVVQRRVPFDVAADRPLTGEFGAPVVEVETAGERLLGDVDGEVRGTGLIRRRPQQARGGDPRQIVAEEKPALHRLKLQGLRAQHRAQIGGDEVADAGVAAVHGEAAHVSLHHVDGEDAVAHALGRHVGAGDDVAARAVLRLDLVGDVEDVGEAHFVADERLVERAQLLGREHGGTGDLDIPELKTQLVHRARHRRAPRRLDAEIEVALRRRLRQRPVPAGLDRSRQRARHLRQGDAGGKPDAQQRRPHHQRGPCAAGALTRQPSASSPRHPSAPSPHPGPRIPRAGVDGQKAGNAKALEYPSQPRASTRKYACN